MGDASFKILGPIDPVNEKETNNYSIVMRLVYGDTAFMFTGDAETDSEEEILENFSRSEFSSDVLKVGHHGSTTSTGEAFLSAVNPSIAVISCGEGNSYGHPHDEIIELLEKNGITVTETIDSFIESAVKELDLITSTIYDGIIVDTEEKQEEPEFIIETENV